MAEFMTLNLRPQALVFLGPDAAATVTTPADAARESGVLKDDVVPRLSSSTVLFLSYILRVATQSN